jgi:hypothetical protein
VRDLGLGEKWESSHVARCADEEDAGFSCHVWRRWRGGSGMEERRGKGEGVSE